MKRKICILLIMVMFVVVCCVSGCSGCSCNGEKSIHESQTEDTNHTVCEYDFPNEEKLGLPLYKGNVMVNTVESSTTESDGVLKDIGVDYSTSDDFKTVALWYKEQMGQPTKDLTTPDGKKQFTWQSSEGGYYNLIVVTETDDGTAISVIKSKE